jgi:hypothetical protein
VTVTSRGVCTQRVCDTHINIRKACIEKFSFVQLVTSVKSNAQRSFSMDAAKCRMESIVHTNEILFRNANFA